MATKVKLDNSYLKKLERKEYKRKENFRTKRRFYLIVCEGEKTEPNYFNSLKQSLPKGVLELNQIDINGTGKNTISIIQEAQELREAYEQNYSRQIDEVWAVFDKDSFSSQTFNTAILKGKGSNPEIHCAWTNEAFELWYLLHFNYYNTGISRSQYQKKLEQEIRNSSGNKTYKYKKNSNDMFKILLQYGNLDNAIKNAKKLESLYSDNKFSNHNPCTKVHILVSKLFELTKEYASQKTIK